MTDTKEVKHWVHEQNGRTAEILVGATDFTVTLNERGTRYTGEPKPGLAEAFRSALGVYAPPKKKRTAAAEMREARQAEVFKTVKHVAASSSTGLAFVPSVVTDLCSKLGINVETALAVLLETAKAGRVGLQPEGGINRLTAGEKAKCPKRGSTCLCWASPVETTLDERKRVFIDAVKELERSEHRALYPLRRVRELAVAAHPMTKPEQDEALFHLISGSPLAFHHHDHAGGVSAEERADWLEHPSGAWFHAVGLRS